MTSPRTPHRTRTATAAIVGSLVVLTTMLWPGAGASAADGDGSKVHACVVPASGNVRIVDSADTCRKNETPLEWTRNGGAAYAAGFGLVLGPNNEFSVTGAPWGGLTNVPAGFADNVDDDGSSQVAALRMDLTRGDGSVVNGAAIWPGSISAWSLSGTYGQFGEELVIGAVTSEKIADGTIESRDLNAALRQRLAALESKVADLEARLAALEAE